jgi:hypothetical protein
MTDEKKTPALDALNEAQRTFVCEYVKDGNGRRAATAAGYAPDNAMVQASNLLRKDKVREALKELHDEAGYTLEWLSAELQGIIKHVDMSDFQQVIEGSMTLPELRDTGVDTRNVVTYEAEVIAAIGLKPSYRKVKIRLHDRGAAFDRLAKLAGLLVDRQERTTTGDGVNTITVPEGDYREFLAWKADN